MSVKYKINIIQKGDAFGIIAFDSFNEADVLGNYDSRTRTGFRQIHDNPATAEESYEKAIKNALATGWKIVYTTDRNYDDFMGREF